MNIILWALTLLVSSGLFAQDGKISVFVNLSPAGSFQAVSSNIKGKLIQKGNTFLASKIYSPVLSFKTGIELRDQHFHEHLNAKTQAYATLTNLKGENGKARAELTINGVKIPINIVYKVKGKMVEAKFKVKASSFNLKKVIYLGVGVEDVVVITAILPFQKG